MFSWCEWGISYKNGFSSGIRAPYLKVGYVYLVGMSSTLKLELIGSVEAEI